MATTHSNCDHPSTKAARAACRRGKVQSSPTDKTVRAARKVKAQPTPRDHDEQRRDGRVGESRLATAQAACKHPVSDWVLKGATKRKTGEYYCKCGKHVGAEGPRDLQNLFRF